MADRTLSWGAGTLRPLSFCPAAHSAPHSFFLRRADLARALLTVLTSGPAGPVAVGEICSEQQEVAEMKNFQVGVKQDFEIQIF